MYKIVPFKQKPCKSKNRTLHKKESAFSFLSHIQFDHMVITFNADWLNCYKQLELLNTIKQWKFSHENGLTKFSYYSDKILLYTSNYFWHLKWFGLGLELWLQMKICVKTHTKEQTAPKFSVFFVFTIL